MVSRDGLLRLIRFGAVGGLSTAIYFGVYTALSLAHAPLVLASVGAYIVSAAGGYWLHHQWTFATKSQSPRNFTVWLALQGTVLVLNILALTVLVQTAGLDQILAQAVILPLLPLMTYFLSQRWVFVAAKPSA